MREYLKKDIHIFSGLRTHAQLAEARSLLMDNGKVRSYESFEQKVTRLNEAYNRDYLQAEYQFAISSAESAANWNNLQDDTDRYWLEYRTAGDERVRAEHRTLHGICLPKNDPFWQEYYPPNGWRCRCVAVEVLADDYTLSDSKKSIKKGETATTTIGKSGKNTAEMFRFNPGIKSLVFPPKHTYTKVVGAMNVKNIIKKEIEYKNISMDQLKEMYQSQRINIQNENVIMDLDSGYVGTSNSFYLNGKLRNNENLSKDDKQTIEALDNLIKSNKLPIDLTLKRFVSDDFIKSHFDIETKNKSTDETIDLLKSKNVVEFSDKGYTSTSAIETKNVFFNRRFKLEIRAQKGTNAFIVDNFDESEIILGRNQKMKIVDFTKTNRGQINIIAETF